MYERKTSIDIKCPLEYGMDVFGGKWKSRVICLLNQKKKLRYGELKNTLANITDTVLALTLKEMTESGIVERIQYNEIPPRVEYSLSEKGQSIVPVLENICKWAGFYYKNTDETRISICYGCNYSKGE